MDIELDVVMLTLADCPEPWDAVVAALTNADVPAVATLASGMLIVLVVVYV